MTYPKNGLGAGAPGGRRRDDQGIGTKVFCVQTGGFDTHAAQDTKRPTESTSTMATLNDGAAAFPNDLKNQGLLNDTLLLTFSEFGRRITENGSGGTDHGAARDDGDGRARHGGLYGTAPPSTPIREPHTREQRRRRHYETDFRSVYARVIDNWLGTDSTKLLGGNFRKNGLGFI